MIAYVACVAALIPGFVTKDTKTGEREVKEYFTWPLPDDCKATTVPVSKTQVANTIQIKCTNGELFLLPMSQCSLSVIKKDED
ncbi:MAG: hypothetical protein ACREGB_00180 [Candidatus Saccharimonadales bacterium]